MQSIPVHRAVILYKPHGWGLPSVRVVDLDQGVNRLERGYHRSCGAAFTHWREAPLLSCCLMLFADFHSLVVREKIPAAEVHEAFLVIPEYRQLISADIQGAEDDQSRALKSAFSALAAQRT